MADRRRSGAGRPRPRSQHFLRSDGLAAELVRGACVPSGDLVFDLGAGTGRLTAQLASVARLVVAVELDPDLASRPRGRWSNVRVVEGDAAEVGWPDEPFRIVASLPFHRTTDLLHHMLDDPAIPLMRADLIVEWGVALKRAVPWPSTLNDVVWGATYEASVSRRLPRTAFTPQPSVDAGVLVYRRRPRPLVAAEHVGSFRVFAAAGFRRGLRSVAPPHVLRKYGLRAEARELDAHQWAALYRVVRRR